MNKKSLHEMAQSCVDYMNENKRPFAAHKEMLREANERAVNFDYVQRSLSDLDSVHKMVLPSMLEVMHRNHQEEMDTIAEVAYEFRLENLDANRPVNKWETERLNRERVKCTKRRR